MIINIPKMEAQGFQVDIDNDKDIITIRPYDGMPLDWHSMNKQFNAMSLTEAEICRGIEQFDNHINEVQIMKAIRNCQ